MNVSITPELEVWVQNKVNTGLYRSASEVVRDSLRLLRERDLQRDRMVSELRADLLIGMEQLDRGHSRPFTTEVISDVKARGRDRVRAPEGARE